MKSTLLALALATTVTTVAAGCGPALFVGTEPWFQQRGQPDLTKRAAFDMSCAEKELSFHALGDKGVPYDTVGVQGCGQKATYVYHDFKWIMNDVSQEKVGSAGEPGPG